MPRMSRADEKEYLNDSRKKKFDELLCILRGSKSSMKPEEAEKKYGVGTPLVFFHDCSFILGLLNDGPCYISAPDCIYLGPVYRFDYNWSPRGGLVLLRQLAWGRKYYEGDTAVAVDKDLFELLKEKIHFDELEDIPFHDERTCEERWAFVEAVLDYFGRRRDDIGVKLRVDRVAEYFNNEDQEGPAFMESLQPEEFLLAQKRIEEELWKNLSVQSVNYQGDVDVALGLLRLGKAYHAGTERAKELLLEKIGVYEGLVRGELADVKKELRELARKKEELGG